MCPKAIGGTFASPSRTYPSLFPPNGLFGKLPYLLPNLICAALLFLSIVAGYLLLEETHPDLQPWSTQGDLDTSTAETPLIATAGATADSGVDLRADSYGTFNAVDIQEEQRWKLNPDGTSRPASFTSDKKVKFLTWRVSMLIVALGIFTYHSMTFDHLLPIFLQDDRIDGSDLPASAFNMPGGLGLKIQTVGVIMSVNGLIALFIQAVIFPVFAAWLGVWRVFVMVTILHPLCYYVVPYLVWLPDNLVFPGIYTCLAIRNFTSILAYPVLLILLKQASPSGSVLGKINGLAASAGAACRTVAPPVAGLLYGIGIDVGFTGLAWWCSALVALIGALQLWFVDRENSKNVVVRAAAPCLSSINKQGQKEEIHIVVIETAEV